MTTVFLAHDNDINIIRPRFFDTPDEAEKYMNDELERYGLEHPLNERGVPFDGFIKVNEEMSVADALNYIMNH